MSVRILHAADLHLDSPFEALTLAQAAQRRREQRSLLRALPELAQAHGAQIILLAGDLLDSASPYPETAKALAETFAGCVHRQPLPRSAAGLFRAEAGGAARRALPARRGGQSRLGV